ncbi:phage tail tube assembly chaperone [Liquorilactobacillus uvarum]|uniref:Phage protein n=1 Tax=Liquorilactobacillus uvarum DSM 19971 TaxID=1423812 RepID=A0A0R1PW54_9LACO|nr:phage tail tube assembly chaperone [Liquorilactobacillus uvarum]KRL36622.1 hypothetical protein FD20_GL001165 [Liquorilactobacillus uvarum DSM 19971]
MEIYLKEFNKKFVVKASNKVMKKTYKVQLKMAKADDIADVAPQEQIERSLEMTESVEEYLKDVLKLNDKEYEKLEDLEFEPTIDLTNHVALRVMGLSETDIEDANRKKK